MVHDIGVPWTVVCPSTAPVVAFSDRAIVAPVLVRDTAMTLPPLTATARVRPSGFSVQQGSLPLSSASKQDTLPLVVPLSLAQQTVPSAATAASNALSLTTFVSDVASLLYAYRASFTWFARTMPGGEVPASYSMSRAL